MNIAEWAIRLLQGGLGNLAAYLAAHVLLCLVPAFFVAGAMAALLPQESVTRFLGRNTPKYISYPAAAAAGSLLAVCSCTIVPLFAGIYRKGAGIGPAITFLFIAPAANILALAYTGVAIGGDIALARIVLSWTFGIGIGLIMALIFHQDDSQHDVKTNGEDPFVRDAGKARSYAWLFLLILVALLVAGTLKVEPLTNSYARLTLPVSGVDRFQATLYRLVPFDASKGEEGVSAQGVVLIALLALIGVSAWRGLENVGEGFTRWTWVALGLVILTVLVAAVNVVPQATSVLVNFPGKFFAVVLALSAIAYLARTRFEAHEIQEWLWESWRFVKQIFPLLIVGVFFVGVMRQIIRPEWIESLAGHNTLVGNLAGVIFGVFMYFPTLVEVPIAKMFLSLGMHRGPLLAYLMSDPELSLQSILILSAIIGRVKAWTYVGWVALFSLVSGLLYGAWVDGTSLLLILAYLAGLLAVLGVALSWAGRRKPTAEPVPARKS
jgi:uncharacterized membrane protein YraQ (UPF0718 family)